MAQTTRQKYTIETEHFYSELENEDICDKDYKQACNIWNTYKIETHYQYAEVYLQTDALLLVDIFKNFRNVCLKTYELDVLYYYTLLGFAANAMLKITVELELLIDSDMALFTQNAIRGRISQCSNRYAIANNKYIPGSAPDWTAEKLKQ